jgi:N-acetylglucosamine kinase-like BadF-type ATPase
VVESAESGDEVANKILHNSVGELASSVKAVVQRLELGGEGNTPVLSDLFLNTCTTYIHRFVAGTKK